MTNRKRPTKANNGQLRRDYDQDVSYRDTPTHLFTEWYLFVAAPILIVLVTGVFIHYSTVAIPVGESVIDESIVPSMNSKDSKIKLSSMFEEYILDFQSLSQERKANMKKYHYSHKRTGVDKRSGLSLQEFYDVYDAKWPVIITDAVPTWPASNWTREFFNSTYGKERVTMKAVDGTLDKASSLALPLELFYKNSHLASQTTWTYLEDELFIPLRPELYKDIRDSIYTGNDLFKLFPKEIRPWDAMFLWGTQYSRSSLHIDPYNWTGTNAVISGRKRWRLFPPGQDDLLAVKRGVKSGFPINCYKYNSPLDMFSEDSRAILADSTYIEFDQLPGELLIIPTGWLHQAYNVKETMAISGQLMNRNNYRVILEELFKADSLQRSLLPPYADSMGPPDQVSAAMNTLTPSQLQHGRDVTDAIIKQVMSKKPGH